ncbi:MAG: cell wall-binding repeat-containing protein [Gracilibacteraceae bacterium]|jgi:putative cell wall-binding protein|nr:cell wall-binding repeat-containing protein [Gracilibacteraceae bacterium]
MRNKKVTWALIVCLFLLFLPLQTVLGADVATERLAGADRYQTAVSISQAGWTTAENAVLAAGSDANLVDALTVAPLAKLLGAPILLTENGRLTAVSAAELQRLGVKTVYLSSGSGVITQPVQDAVRALGIEIVPLGGADRFATAANIAAEIAKRTTVTTVVITTAYSNADALSVASIAAKNGWPILLTAVNALPASVTAFISAHSISASYVVGGTGVVSDGVLASLPAAVRLGGATRYDTNLAVLQQFADSWDYAKGLFIANGTNSHLVDALTASAYIAGAPLLLTDNSVVSAAAKAFLAGKNITRVVGLGGVTVTSESVLSQIVAAIAPVVTGGGGRGNGPNTPPINDTGESATNPQLSINEADKYVIGKTATSTPALVTFFNGNTPDPLKGDTYNNLTIASGVKAGDVGVAGITVNNTATINGGGSESVYLYSITAPTAVFTVNQNVQAPKGTSLKLGGSTNIYKIELDTVASVYTPNYDTSTPITIGSIYVNRSDTAFTLGAPVNELHVVAPADGVVDNITLSAHTDITALTIVVDTKNITGSNTPTVELVLDTAFIIEYADLHSIDANAVASDVDSRITVETETGVSITPTSSPEENMNLIYLQMAKEAIVAAAPYVIPNTYTGTELNWAQSTVNTIISGLTDSQASLTTATVAVKSGDLYTVELSNSQAAGDPASESFDITVTKQAPTQISPSDIVVTVPVYGGTPQNSVASGTGYTGTTITWGTTPSTTFTTFAANTVYTATVTLTPATGYTFAGVAFTVNGVAVPSTDVTINSSTGAAVITKVFPATKIAIPSTVSTIAGVYPVYGMSPDTIAISIPEYTVSTVRWTYGSSNPVTFTGATFGAGGVYNVEFDVTPKDGYAFDETNLSFFNLLGASTTDTNYTNGVAHVVGTFPATGTDFVYANAVAAPVATINPLYTIGGPLALFFNPSSVVWQDLGGITHTGAFALNTVYKAVITLTSTPNPAYELKVTNLPEGDNLPGGISVNRSGNTITITFPST